MKRSGYKVANFHQPLCFLKAVSQVFLSTKKNLQDPPDHSSKDTTPGFKKIVKLVCDKLVIQYLLLNFQLSDPKG